MKKFNLFFSFMLVTLASMAKPWTAKTLPVPDNTTDSTLVTYVCNPDHILSPAEVDSIDQIMLSLEKAQGVRGLVICVAETDPDDPYSFCIEVGNTYGIGGKSNTGFILFLSTISRGYEILTGDGMEKFLTDAQCSRIGRNEMVPYFKQDEWGAGLMAGLRKIQAVCSGETELSADEEDEDEDDSNILLWFGGGLAALVGAGAYSSRKRKECPKCKQHHYGLKLRQTVLHPDEEGAPSDEEVEQQIKAKLFELSSAKNEDTKGMDTESAPNSATSTKLNDTQKEQVASIGRSAGFVSAAEAESSKKKYRKVRVINVFLCPDCGYLHRTERNATTYDYALGLFTSGAFGAIVHASSTSGSSSSSSHRSSSHRSSGGGHSYGSRGGGHFSGGGAGGRF